MHDSIICERMLMHIHTVTHKYTSRQTLINAPMVPGGSSRSRRSLTSLLELREEETREDGETTGDSEKTQNEGFLDVKHQRSPSPPPSSFFFSSSMACILAAWTSARAFHSPLLMFSPSNMGLISMWKRLNSCKHTGNTRIQHTDCVRIYSIYS